MACLFVQFCAGLVSPSFDHEYNFDGKLSPLGFYALCSRLEMRFSFSDTNVSPSGSEGIGAEFPLSKGNTFNMFTTVEVAHVTLHVAKQDFLALLSAAHRGEQWQSGATSTAYLMRAIDVFLPSEYSRSSLTLSAYR
ncbi:hypothetical protein DUNSADRAFT_7766 [Dunaliella salina]|uniref:Cyclic nucleotide-binding domain-containing protein n=1 Tax=Dunaliella salina TaxID=3046 RepID=A0ABZ3K916_DUNSA|nr:hypothetical protein DUNSADRAFT_7766 [Dunaliella salina]|eukprot:KAF5825664.1 hypothetical protein DUNSADRAFT_7766 [Dunaliella salina]